jgi:hypothetical protein
MGDVTAEARRKVDAAARDAGPWVERLARLGYFSRGAVYVLVALLAAKAALQRHHPVGTRGAFRELVNAPLGRIVLPVLAAGFLGYAVWMLISATLDPERKGTKLKGLGKRVSYLTSFVIYLGMSATAAALALGYGTRGDRESAARWTRPVMRHPLGRWAVGATGLAVAGYGLWLLYRSAFKEPEKRLDLSSCSERVQRTFKIIGRTGIAARGIVFGVVGVWLIRAAIDYRPAEARMPTGALESVREQPHGQWLLLFVAVGLGAFGLFEIVKAKYRRITPAR